jgi:hypothetical protein
MQVQLGVTMGRSIATINLWIDMWLTCLVRGTKPVGSVCAASLKCVRTYGLFRVGCKLIAPLLPVARLMHCQHAFTQATGYTGNSPV